jgi:purine-cytosine permease-like protein
MQSGGLNMTVNSELNKFTSWNNNKLILVVVGFYLVILAAIVITWGSSYFMVFLDVFGLFLVVFGKILGSGYYEYNRRFQRWFWKNLVSKDDETIDYMLSNQYTGLKFTITMTRVIGLLLIVASVFFFMAGATI